MVIGALTQADRIQRDYGPVLSFDVREYISKKMNLGGGSPADEGKQGPPSPGADSPHAGFTGPLQKSKAGATARALKTKVAMGPILGDAMKYLQGNAFTNGVPDPKKVPLALLEHQLMTLQSPDIDKEVAIAAYNQFEDDVYKAVETVKEASVDADKESQRIEAVGKGVTSFARTLFSLKEGMMASALSKEDRASFTKINDAGQRLALKGYHLPVVEMMLVDRMTDSEFTWLKNNAEDQIQAQSFQALRDAPGEFQVVLQNILSQVNPDTGEPFFDPLEVKAAYNKETKEGTLLWNTYNRDGPKRHGTEVMGGPVYIFRGPMPLRGGR